MAFQFAMERPCDAQISDKNTSAHLVQLWFSDGDCFALIHGHPNSWGKTSQDLFLILRSTCNGSIQWSAKKLIEKPTQYNTLSYKLSLEIDRQYNEWRMNKALEEAMCSNLDLT
jgi:hypothetical protein